MDLSLPPATVVTDNADLQQRLDGLRGQTLLALDSEFVRESSYLPRPCLLQLAVAGQEPFAIDLLCPLDYTPLVALLADPAVIKVLHSAHQDLELFVQLFGTPGVGLRDTQIAAELLGLGGQIGYAALVEQRLGVRLGKTETRTDWSRRPLTAAQMAYALDDVRHLPALYDDLHAALQAAGRLHWWEEDCASLQQPALYQSPSPEDAWRRLSAARHLLPEQRAVLRRLSAWREREAQRCNRPRRWVLDDAALYALAKRQPLNRAMLEEIAELPAASLRRHGEVWLAEIADCRQQGERIDDGDGARLSPEQQQTLTRLQEVTLRRAERLGLAPATLASRRDLEASLFGLRSGKPWQGWRAEHLAADLQHLLQECEPVVD